MIDLLSEILASNNPLYTDTLKGIVESMNIQNTYDMTKFRLADKIVVFLAPYAKSISGGVMSIFSLCRYSREICKDSECIIASQPGISTYSENDFFKNDEKVYRWKQVVENAQSVKKMILHVPEYIVKDLYKSLDEADINFLKNIEDLQINIMNQNIEQMSESEAFADLYTITNNITQTVAHNRTASQEVCDRFNIPTHLFSVYTDYSRYKQYKFEDKEKLIILSPDNHEKKVAIAEKIQRELPDFKIVTFNNIPYSEYLDLISKAFITITFGEGFDSYFIEPNLVNSLSLTVYNDDFFPDKSWADEKTVYSSYDEMYEKIVDDIKQYTNNKNEYEKITKKLKEKFNKIYDFDKFIDNLKRYYEGKYDFYPKYGLKDIFDTSLMDRPPRAVPDYGKKVKYNLPYVPYIETHLCDHCNLNCKGCGHCCPLAPESFTDFEQYEKDINELATKISLGKIRLMGGEPLLNTDVNKFVKATRKAFPKTDIRIVTNAILLPTMRDEFWQTVIENDVLIDMTRYPIVADKFQYYVNLIQSKGARLGDISIADEFFNASNIKGDSDMVETHRNCESNVCANLWQSKLFTCPMCYRYYFNQYFGTNLKLPKGIDIYKATGEEIRDGLSKPIEQCKYCNPTNMVKYKWEQTKHEIFEWS